MELSDNSLMTEVRKIALSLSCLLIHSGNCRIATPINRQNDCKAGSSKHLKLLWETPQ